MYSLNNGDLYKEKEIEVDQAGTEFANYVKERVILNYNGEQLENTFMNSDQSLDDKNPNDAFSIDLLKEYKTISKKEDRNYPLFICEVKGEKYYVAPVMGKGLWAAVWGYIALDENGEKISKSKGYKHMVKIIIFVRQIFSTGNVKVAFIVKALIQRSFYSFIYHFFILVAQMNCLIRYKFS